MREGACMMREGAGYDGELFCYLRKQGIGSWPSAATQSVNIGWGGE